MGNACTNCQACRGDDGNEHGEITAGDKLNLRSNGVKLSKEEINYFAHHVDVIIRL
jgi:hypothetical protein